MGVRASARTEVRGSWGAFENRISAMACSPRADPGAIWEMLARVFALHASSEKGNFHTIDFEIRAMLGAPCLSNLSHPSGGACIMIARETTQLSVFLGNHPGVVADLCTALTNAKISIEAMTVLDTVDVGTMRMVVDDVELAKNALKGSGAAYVEVPVLAIEIDNNPGAFARIARTMSNAGVNIEYVYATAMPGISMTLGIFRVSDIDTALKLNYSETSENAPATTPS